MAFTRAKYPADDQSEHAADVILAQQITMIPHINDREKTVVRLGGNRTFDEGTRTVYDALMSQCYAVVATNNRLYRIAAAANRRAYLIPNGLDLAEWSPVKYDGPFTVGFCGNIAGPIYREYKGYDLVDQACRRLGIPIKTALFKDKQIPHDRMRADFYSRISVLVHPTKGEGCSNTIMEALACGVPVITTREAGYHGELMKDRHDILFCRRDATDIADKLLTLIRQDYFRQKLGARGRDFAEHHHDIRKIAAQYAIVFEECAKDQARRREAAAATHPEQTLLADIIKAKTTGRPLDAVSLKAIAGVVKNAGSAT